MKGQSSQLPNRILHFTYLYSTHSSRTCLVSFTYTLHFTRSTDTLQFFFTHNFTFQLHSLFTCFTSLSFTFHSLFACFNEKDGNGGIFTQPICQHAAPYTTWRKSHEQSPWCNSRFILLTADDDKVVAGLNVCE